MGLGMLTREAGACKKTSNAVKSNAKPNDRPIRNQHSTSNYKYEEAHVLLLQWEEDNNLRRSKQIRQLKRVLVDRIHVTNCWLMVIPSIGSFGYLQQLLHDFITQYSKPKNLLMVYYGGHGGVGKNGNLRWHKDRNIWGPKLDWSLLQVDLEGTESDLVLFLDCCHSASSVTAADPSEFREGGRTELISACGFNASAYSGKHSFTAALVAELKDRSESENTFSVIGLHHSLLARMKDFPRSKKGKPSTPVHMLLAGNEHAPPISFKRLPVRREKFLNYDSSSDPIEIGRCYKLAVSLLSKFRF